MAKAVPVRISFDSNQIVVKYGAMSFDDSGMDFCLTDVNSVGKAAGQDHLETMLMGDGLMCWLHFDTTEDARKLAAEIVKAATMMEGMRGQLEGANYGDR